MKVSDKIKERVERGEQFFSFEFFPPRTEEVRGAAQRPANEREAFGGWGEGAFNPFPALFPQVHLY